MREYTNLGWPDTPFGADKRPFPRKVHLIAATAIQWATDGRRPVPAAAALAYLPVRPHHTLPLLPETLHFGYRVAVIDDPADPPALAALVDGHLVQGRRHAAALAVHGWAGDAAALTAWAAGDTPGITAVADALASQAAPERGTALVIDTCADMLPDAACRHGLDITIGDGGLLDPREVQDAHEHVIGGRNAGERDSAAQALGLSALCQALVTALLGGKGTGLCIWNPPFPVDQPLGNVAWDSFPEILPGLAPAPLAGG